MKTNLIYTGECIKIMNSLEKEKIDLIFADPPYNLSGNNLKWIGNKTGGDWHMINEKWDKMPEKEYFNFTYEWIKASKKTLKSNGSIYISCTYHRLYYNYKKILDSLKRICYIIKEVKKQENK